MSEDYTAPSGSPTGARMMFYAERMGDMDAGESYIAERGVFLCIEEFVPYRRMGWEASKQINAIADEWIKREDGE